MSKISGEMVEHVALLSRLTFSREEVEKFTEHLNRILEYVDKLNELDTSNISPTSHSLKMYNILRDDRVEESLTNEEALENAPDKESGCFKVPRVIQ